MYTCTEIGPKSTVHIYNHTPKIRVYTKHYTSPGITHKIRNILTTLGRRPMGSLGN